MGKTIVSETIITPSGTDALQAGTFTDDAGERFVGLVFQEPGIEPVMVTLTVDLFRQYVGHLGKVLKAVDDPKTWR